MQILVNPADELPIYRQIMRQITKPSPADGSNRATACLPTAN
ncbi:MAG TPA: hypothetical protein VHW09_07680 [Bryobacteraceae bacterium]|nr:hypothetical protein [Bryobacteraceae bacterium]